MSGMNIRDQIKTQGFSFLETNEKNIADIMNNSTENLSQVDLLKMQQQTNQYANTITMLTTILKNLTDSDKEVIRNC